MADEKININIEFGQRLFMFSLVYLYAVAVLVLYAIGLVEVGALEITMITLGAVATGQGIARGVEKAAKERANGTLEIGEVKDAIGFKVDNDG